MENDVKERGNKTRGCHTQRKTGHNNQATISKLVD